MKITDILVSYCPHSHKVVQQQKTKQKHRQFRIVIPYLQNLHFNNLAMYTVQRFKHTSFTKKKGAACLSGSGRLWYNTVTSWSSRVCYLSWRPNRNQETISDLVKSFDFHPQSWCRCYKVTENAGIEMSLQLCLLCICFWE